jgi:hypothetical protein
MCRFKLKGHEEDDYIDIDDDKIETFKKRIVIEGFLYGNHLHLYFSVKSYQDVDCYKWVTENYKTLKIKSNKYKRIIIKDSL